MSWMLCGKDIAMTGNEAVARWKIKDLQITADVILIRNILNNKPSLGVEK